MPRPRGIICGPRCKYWVWLYHKSAEDHDEVCECPERKSHINGKQFPVVEGKYCSSGVSM